MPPIDEDPSAETIRARRRDDFNILAPLVVLGVLLSAIALAFAIAAAWSSPGGESANSASSGSTGGADQMQGMQMDDASSSGQADFEMKPYDPVTKPVKAGPKTFELTTTEHRIKVGDSVYTMWTFNNTVPGPVLRAVVGDKITIKINNDKDSSMPHSVDFHASRMTLGGGALQLAPGSKGTFSFTAEYPGVFMYHCATSPVLHHIGMGMYGMLIVQPKEGFGETMPEYAITQSELYSSSEDIDQNRPKAMAFNGIPNQYVQKPIHLPADSHVRLFVLNAGPSELSSFHVVGTVFDRVYTDGNPANISYGRQALAIPSSGSGVFEMQLKGEGQYPFVTHQFNLAAKGAVGMLISGDGKPGPGGVANPGANGHH